jgi:hypothetical protein
MSFRCPRECALGVDPVCGVRRRLVRTKAVGGIRPAPAYRRRRTRRPPNRWTTEARTALLSNSALLLAASAAESTSVTTEPVTPSTMSSDMEPRLNAMTGVPQANASTTESPNGASELASTELGDPLSRSPTTCSLGVLRCRRPSPRLLQRRGLTTRTRARR